MEKNRDEIEMVENVLKRLILYNCVISEIILTILR